MFCKKNKKKTGKIKKELESLSTINRILNKDHYFLYGLTTPSGRGPPHSLSFTIKLRNTALGRSPLDERSVSRRNLYLTTHNTHSRQIFMPPAGFKPAILSNEQQQTHSLDRAATVTGTLQS